MKINSRSILYILPILLVVLVSGCTSGGGGTSSGVEISNFKVSPDSVFEEGQFLISASLQNLGGKDAENVRALLKLPDTNSVFSLIRGSKDQSLGTMTPKDVKPLNWVLRAPTKYTDSSINEPIKVWVEYKYKTEFTTSITVLSSSELTKVLQNGGEIPTSSLSGGVGPVSIEMQNTNIPYIVSPSGGTRKVTLNLVVKNVGSGIVTDSTRGTGLLNDYKVRIENLQVLGRTGGNCDAGEVYIGPKKDNPDGFPISCDVTLTAGNDDISRLAITATISYPYRVEADANIKVNDKDSSNPTA